MGDFLTSSTQILPAPTAGLTTYQWQPSQTQAVNTFAAKIDHYFSTKHRVFGSLWWGRDVANADNLSMAVFGGAATYYAYPNPKLQWSYSKLLQSWTVNDTYTISPSMLNNFILGVRRLAIPLLNTYSPTNTLFTAADLGVGSVGDANAPDVQRVSMPGSCLTESTMATSPSCRRIPSISRTITPLRTDVTRGRWVWRSANTMKHRTRLSLPAGTAVLQTAGKPTAGQAMASPT